MMKNQLPLGYRDYCAHALIPLNRCRVANLYLPWTCQNQKHAYEKCQYEEYVRWTGAGAGQRGAKRQERRTLMDAMWPCICALVGGGQK